MKANMKKSIALLSLIALAVTGCGQSTTTGSSAAGSQGTVSFAAATASGDVKVGEAGTDTTDWDSITPATEITFWSTKEDCFQDLCAEFTAETGITVNATYMGGYDDMVSKVMAGIAAKNLPDVAQLGQRHGLAQMYDSGYLLPIENYLSDELLDDIIPGFWKRFTYKDTRVIVPFQNSMPMLYYNKTLFEENGIQIPETFDGVVATAGEITDKTGIYGFTFNKDYPWYILALMYNSNTKAVTEDGKANMNTEETRKILEAVSQMANVDKSMPANQHATAQEDFCNGNIGMFMTSCASYAKIQKLVDGKFEVGIAQFPSITTMDIPMGGNGLGCFKSTPEKEKAATMFVNFMLDKDRIANNTLNSGYIPVTNAAMATDTYQTYLEDENRKVVNDQLQYLGGAAVNPTDSLVWDELESLVDSIEADPKVDISARLDEIDRKIENYLNQYAGK